MYNKGFKHISITEPKPHHQGTIILLESKHKIMEIYVWPKKVTTYIKDKRTNQNKHYEMESVPNKYKSLINSEVELYNINKI